MDKDGDGRITQAEMAEAFARTALRDFLPQDAQIQQRLNGYVQEQAKRLVSFLNAPSPQQV